MAPSRDYLFDPTNNVELGTAYLNVLMFNQLDDVAHNVSLEYCVIAAYNTDPCNMFRTFSRTVCLPSPDQQPPTSRRL